MKKITIGLLFMSLTIGSFGNPFVVADTLRINGHMAIWLGSSDYYEDGFNYGWLLGDRIKGLFENYMFTSSFGSVAGYHQARQIFDQHFVVDDKYIEMTQGMILGMEMAGVDLYSTVLNDTLNYKDILIANSVQDFISFSDEWHNIGPGCSSLTSWGEATMNAPELLGETVINRNLDWDNDPQLINNPLIIIWVTADPAKQSFVTFGFPGLIGALSGVNEYGIATFHNTGNYFTYPTGTGFYPSSLAQRNGLEAADYNDDGICSPRDVTDAVRAHTMACTHIIHNAGPSFMEPAAEILEIHNSFGYAIRTKANNPEFFGDNLVATNHFRLLKPATGCSRYNRIRDSLLVSNQLDVNRNWTVLKTAGVTTNLQTIQFIPTQNIIRFSFAEVGTPAYLVEPYEIWMDTLFTMFNVGINEVVLSENSRVNIFPNPGKDLINIVVKPETTSKLAVAIKDQRGRVVFREEMIADAGAQHSFKWDTGNLPAGVYFTVVEITDNVTGKVQRESKKIVVTK
jgi:hypothetical protein